MKIKAHNIFKDTKKRLLHNCNSFLFLPLLSVKSSSIQIEKKNIILMTQLMALLYKIEYARNGKKIKVHVCNLHVKC